LQSVHVLGDPGGHLRVVNATPLGGVHRQTDREQLLDHVVAQVRIRCRPTIWSRLATPTGAAHDRLM